MRKALMLLSILPWTLPGCALFAGGRPIVTTQSAGCSSLIPPDWQQGVAGAEIPQAIIDGHAVVADWESFADAQTGKLDQANDHTRAAIGIVARCEARDAAAVQRATRRRVLGIF